MTVVSSLMSVTEMAGVVGVDMVVVFVSNRENVIKENELFHLNSETRCGCW